MHARADLEKSIGEGHFGENIDWRRKRACHSDTLVATELYRLVGKISLQDRALEFVTFIVCGSFLLNRATEGNCLYQTSFIRLYIDFASNTFVG